MEDEEDDGFMDLSAFWLTFLVSYAIVLLGIAIVLYINPRWRRGWFYLIGEIINNCYYFLVDNLPVPSGFRRWQPFA